MAVGHLPCTQMHVQTNVTRQLFSSLQLMYPKHTQNNGTFPLDNVGCFLADGHLQEMAVQLGLLKATSCSWQEKLP